MGLQGSPTAPLIGTGRAAGFLQGIAARLFNQHNAEEAAMGLAMRTRPRLIGGAVWPCLTAV